MAIVSAKLGGGGSSDALTTREGASTFIRRCCLTCRPRRSVLEEELQPGPSAKLAAITGEERLGKVPCG